MSPVVVPVVPPVGCPTGETPMRGVQPGSHSCGELHVRRTAKHLHKRVKTWRYAKTANMFETS